MMFQVVLWSSLLFVATGSFANPQIHAEKDAEQSEDLKELFSELTDTTAKWNSLKEKFEKIQNTECLWPANSGLCNSIQEQVDGVKAKSRSDEEEEKLIQNIFGSLQRKVKRLEREAKVGAPVSTNAVRDVERSLRYLHMKITEQRSDPKSQLTYALDSDDDSLEDSDNDQWVSDTEDVQGIKHLGKTCKLLVNPYKKLLSTVHRLDGAVEVMNRKSASCYQRLDGLGSYHGTTVRNFNHISNKIESLWKMTSRELNENRKILRGINKKLETELTDDDQDDEDLKKSLKRFMVEQRKELEKTIKKALSKRSSKDDDDTDDTDDDSREKGKRRSKDDTDDDTDESCDDSDGCDRKRKKGKDTDDSDDDDSREKGRRRSKDDTDDDTDESCDDSDGCDRKRRKGKDTDDSDEDDSREKGKRRSKDDTDDDTDESCDDSDGCDRKRGKGKDTDDSDDDDDDDEDDGKRKGKKTVKKDSWIEEIHYPFAFSKRTW